MAHAACFKNYGIYVYMDHFVGVKGHQTGYKKNFGCDTKNKLIGVSEVWFESVDTEIKKDENSLKSSEWRHPTGCFRTYNDELL